MWENINSSVKIGSEGGAVILDEEYKKSCRITLEKCTKYYAITCSIYGGMVHTIFCSANFQSIYDRVKKELQEFMDRSTSETEEQEFYEYITNTF